MSNLNQLALRTEYLEDVNRWYLVALDMVAALGDIHSGITTDKSLESIFETTRACLERLMPLHGFALYTVDEEDAGFVMEQCAPQRERDFIEQEVNNLILDGTFAWAVTYRRTVQVTSECGTKTILMHLLATKSRVRGMCVLTLERGAQIHDAALNLLSIAMQHTAHALESLELYRVIKHQNHNLEQAVQLRTQELAYQSLHDELTGLSNRALFNDHLRLAIAQADRSGTQFAVLCLDMDRFKLVNDSMGHETGDRLLCAVAQRLLLCIRKGDTVARLGGDEFALLLTDVQRVEDAARTAQKVQDSLCETFQVDEQRYHLTVSIGISIYPEDGRDATSLLKNADSAMHNAKEIGKNNYQLFAPDMNTRYFRQLYLENAMHEALERGEFVLHYQPQINFVTGAVIGAEALVRWHHPDLGLISPADFIPLAEECGMILPLGDWVLKTACMQLKSWRDLGLPKMRIAVNLSVRQFRMQIIETITDVLLETGLNPEDLELEITESVSMHGSEIFIDVLHKLRDIGIAVALDDFGTGYSSLSYLRKLAVSVLKIDRSFVHELPHNADDVAIAKAVIVLARSLNLQVVAEGVETAEQFDFLSDAGCDIAQGFYCAKPMAGDDFTSWIKHIA